jgi:hypothetical protein
VLAASVINEIALMMKVLSRNLPGGNEKIHRKLQSEKPVSGTSRIRSYEAGVTLLDGDIRCLYLYNEKFLYFNPVLIPHLVYIPHNKDDTSKAVPLHAMEALGGRGGIAPDHT